MRRARVIALVAILAVVVVALAYFLAAFPLAHGGASNASTAPGFSLSEINGQTFSLSSYRNTSVVVIEFTSLSCSACQIVEQSLQTLYTDYNHTDPGQVVIVSVYIEPQFGDTVPALQQYQAKHNITWAMVRDTPTLAVSSAYGVSDIPTIVIVDKQGHPVYDSSGLQGTSQIQSGISSALSGNARTTSIVTVSVFALAAVAGVTTFFSPCAFPMFPGYMSLFLGMKAGDAAPDATSGPTYRRAAWRALSAGSTTALGMLIVFLLIGVALVYAASVVGSYIPYFQIIVGVVLVALGGLLLTNLQYWRVVKPLQQLWGRMRGRPSSDAAPIGATAAAGEKGFYLKLFSYGMGYAAAAAGCVAPVIFSAMVAGWALGLLGGLLSILIFGLTAALLMIVVTVLMALAGRRYVNQLKAYTPLIKKVSAAVLIVVGVYLIYFFYTAWVL